MSISRQRFDQARQLWGSYSSWAIWRTINVEQKPKADIGHLTVLDPDDNPSLLDQLKPDVVMLGLNAASRPIGSEPWSNFHDPRPMATDFKIRFAFEGTPYWGAYMTDVLVGLHETDSQKVAAYINANRGDVARQIGRLEQELHDIGAANPLLIAFGADAHRTLRDHLGSKYELVKVPHYAHRINKESYRAAVIDALAKRANRTQAENGR